jgi:hypothetical protein
MNLQFREKFKLNSVFHTDERSPVSSSTPSPIKLGHLTRLRCHSALRSNSRGLRLLSDMETTLEKKKRRETDILEDFEKQQKSQGALNEEEHKHDIVRLMYQIIKRKYATYLQTGRNIIPKELKSGKEYSAKYVIKRDSNEV